MVSQSAVIQISRKFKSKDARPVWLRWVMPISKQIRILRRTLGMTQQQLAKRACDSQSNVSRIESDETQDMLISTIARIAEALECDIVIRFLPKKPVEKMIEQRAEVIARKIVSGTAGNMAMELQQPTNASIRQEVENVKKEILTHRRSILWDEDNL